MATIPEIAIQIVDRKISEFCDENSRTIFMVGSKSVGKSTLLYLFLEKSESPRPTLMLEYSFGRKSAQKQSVEKMVCHIWEYGGKIEMMKNILPSIHIQGKYFYCVMVDLSKVKYLWNTLEACMEVLNKVYSGVDNYPEIIIIGGKYDLFKNYDSDLKKFICTTLRSVAMLYNTHLIFHSSKEQTVAKRTKDMLYSIGFGSGVPFKEKNTNYIKPLMIPKGSDNWDSIGVKVSSLEQIKVHHMARVPIEIETDDPDVPATVRQGTHPEAVLDSLAASKYQELRHLDSLDMSIHDHLMLEKLM